MFPWLWLWSPHFLVHDPLSGAVTQAIQDAITMLA